MSASVSYSAAVAELGAIRDRLSRADPDEVEALTRRAAQLIADTRAALRRAGDAVNVLQALTCGSAESS